MTERNIVIHKSNTPHVQNILQPQENVNSHEAFFDEVAQKWLGQIKDFRKHSTYIKYCSLYELHIKESLQGIKVSEITNILINQYLFDTEYGRELSANTKRSIIVMVNQILNYAHEYLDYPALKLSNKFKQGQNRRIEIINRSEQALLFRYLCQNMDISKAGIILCISTGLRLGEICALKWTDIDMEQMIIHISRTVQRIASSETNGKTTLMITSPKSIFSIREIPISKEIKILLCKMKQMQAGPYVLGGNKPLEPRTYQNRFKKYLREINIREYNFHTIRHTFATNCIDNGMDVKSLSEILGHSDVKITLDKYVHPTMDTKRRHIAALTSAYVQFCEPLQAAQDL